MNTRIKELREKLGLTQEEFGKRIGSARNTIANYENGNRNPSNAVITSICREFGVTENWLRNGSEPKYSIENDDYTKISVEIDRNDPKARKAIIDYWNLSEQDKVLFWKFVERFLKKDGE